MLQMESFQSEIFDFGTCISAFNILDIFSQIAAKY
jgi:hypothetical protein